MKRLEVQKAKVDIHDLEELACMILGIDYDEIDGDYSTIESELYHQLNIEFDDFSEIVNRLMPLIDMGRSPLTEKHYKGFSDVKNQRWIAKIEW